MLALMLFKSRCDGLFSCTSFRDLCMLWDFINSRSGVPFPVHQEVQTFQQRSVKQKN